MDTHLQQFRMLWPPIQEEKKRYRAESSFFSCRLCEWSEGHAVLYYEMVDGYENGALGISIPKNSITFAYYWVDRPFNLYHWIAPDGSTIGYYFNICDQVTIETNGISWRDLILDVYVEMDHARILDEDEIPEDIEPSILDFIQRSKDELLLHYQEVLASCVRKSQSLWNMGTGKK